MNKKLLVGPAGSGKTYQVLSEFLEALQEGSDPFQEDLYFIVPSLEHTERIMTLLLQRQVKGVFYRRVTTLSRFITDVFKLPQDHIIPNPTRMALLRDLLSGKELEYFSEVQQSPGFLDLTAKFISELRESLISVPHFRDKMNRLKTLQPELSIKYENLADLYERYDETLKAQGWQDPQELLGLIQQLKDKGEWWPPSLRKVWLDGFFDFSNLQLEYLNAITSCTNETTVTLTYDTTSSRCGLFEMVRQTSEALESRGFAAIVQKGPLRRTSDPALLHLEKNIFHDTQLKKNMKVPDSILFFESVGIQGEMELIAREVVRLYRLGNKRFSDFAILLREIGHYDSVIQSVFARYGIPIEIHEREKLNQSALIQTVVLFLKIFREGWKRYDLINFLKSSYVTQLAGESKDEEWIHLFEHWVLRQGFVKDRADWLSREPEVSEEDQAVASFHHKKKLYLETLASLEDQFRNAKGFVPFKTAFFDALNQLGLGVATDLSQEAFRRDATSRRRLESLFEEIRVYFNQSKVKGFSFDDFVDRLLYLIDLDLYSLHHRDKNRVQIYSVSLARQKEYPVVFVAGLLEKNFPKLIKEDPILSDWERKLTHEENNFNLSERLPRQNLERYLFYLAVTRARERLILSCPRLDREGKESLPSFYLEEVKGLFDREMQHARQNLARPYPMFHEALNVRELEISTMGELWNPHPDEEDFLLYLTSQLLRDEKRKKRFDHALLEIKAELHDQRIAEGNFFRPLQTSPTRLEEYGKCHFRYFADKVLHLQDPEEDLNIKRRGIILHQVLENFFRATLQGKRKDLKQPAAAQKFALAELEKALVEHPLSGEKKYQLDLEKAMLKEMLLSFLFMEIERLQTSSLQPAYLEYSFGTGKNPDAEAFEISKGEEVIKIVGKIDRIDIDQDQKVGLVMDYKRTARFKKDDMDLGIALQLPLYLMVTEKFLNLKPLGGELYSIRERKKSGFYHADHIGNFSDFPSRALKLSNEEYQQMLGRVHAFVRRYSEEMENLQIEVKPRYCDPFCSYSSVCRIEKWRLPMILEEIQAEDKKFFEEANTKTKQKPVKAL